LTQKYKIHKGFEIDNYTKKKYNVLYIIVDDRLIINLKYILEERIEEDLFLLTLGFDDGEEEQLFVRQKDYNKEFTFLKKRMDDKIKSQKNHKNQMSYIVRVSENPNIINAEDNKSLLTNFFYVDL